MMNKPLIIVGASGHAAVVADTALQAGYSITGFTDKNITAGTVVLDGGLVLGRDDILNQYPPSKADLAMGIGFMPGSSLRMDLIKKYAELGYEFPSIIHPCSIISPHATIGVGVQIMAGAIIQTCSVIGNNSIINSGAIVEHHSEVGADCHIATGAKLCGEVKIGQMCFIGAGSTVIQTINIGDDSVIAAGSCVIKDLATNSKVAGVPAKSMERSA